jgi:hypothetical protein
MRKLFTIFAITIFVVFTSCSQTPDQDKTSENGPKIDFTFVEYDYGTILVGGNGTSEFNFKNTGTEPLILNDVHSTCGCTVPSWPKEPVKAGETSKIVVVYNTKRVGPINKSISVASNATSTPIVLRIKGNVVPLPVEKTEEQVN